MGQGFPASRVDFRTGKIKRTRRKLFLGNSYIKVKSCAHWV